MSESEPAHKIPKNRVKPTHVAIPVLLLRYQNSLKPLRILKKMDIHRGDTEANQSLGDKMLFLIQRRDSLWCIKTDERIQLFQIIVGP